MHEPKRKVDLEKFVENHTFDFDRVFPMDIRNAEVYAAAVAPLFERMGRLEGFNATVFA